MHTTTVRNGIASQRPSCQETTDNHFLSSSAMISRHYRNRDDIPCEYAAWTLFVRSEMPTSCLGRCVPLLTQKIHLALSRVPPMRPALVHFARRLAGHLQAQAHNFAGPDERCFVVVMHPWRAPRLYSCTVLVHPRPSGVPQCAPPPTGLFHGA